MAQMIVLLPTTPLCTDGKSHNAPTLHVSIQNKLIDYCQEVQHEEKKSLHYCVTFAVEHYYIFLLWAV